jgi:fatty acid-binding protein DegV
MVEVVKVSRYAKTKAKKMAKIRAMLYKYGDIPEEIVEKATRTSTASQWYAIFDNKGNVVSGGRVVKSDWYS